MASVAITGATGFLGKHLVKELLDADYDITAIVRSEQSARNMASQFPQITIIVCEYADYSNIASLCGNQSYSYFFHLAWDGVSGQSRNDFDTQITNVYATLEAIRSAKKMKCSKFIGMGSICEIECLKDIECNHESKSSNYYKVAKLAAGYFGKVEARRLEMDFIWPRLINAYGPNDSPSRLITNTINKILDGISPQFTKGDQLYNFIYATDAVRALRLIAEKGSSNHQYIIGTKDIRPLRDYLNQVGKITDPTVSLKFDESTASVAYLEENDLISYDLFDSLGFSPLITFENGIQSTLEWIKNQR